MGRALANRAGGTPPGSVREPDERDPLPETERHARLMEVFVGVLTHDLRNPLSAVITASQLLEQADVDVPRTAERIRQSAERMGRLIDQLLDFSRIRMGEGLPLDLCEMDLGATGQMVAAELEAAYGERHLQLDAQGDLWGAWDRDRVAQLLSNLGGNACQHGDDPIHIWLDGGEAELVRIGVENRGEIPAEILPDLFEPGARRGTSRGLGLGLFIAQQIAIAHGGTIHVACGGGQTRFLVELPRRPVVDENTGTFKLTR